MKIVVVLEVMWGLRGDPPLRWFNINPYNHSGRRLIDIVGHSDFQVTNSCPDVVYSASSRGTPDPEWLRRNLRVLQPDLVLVCGRVANATFKPDMVRRDAKVIVMQHPAARTWSRAKIVAAQRRVQKAITSLRRLS